MGLNKVNMNKTLLKIWNCLELTIEFKCLLRKPEVNQNVKLILQLLLNTAIYQSPKLKD